MILNSYNQTKLYELDVKFNHLVNLHIQKKLPTKILLSGPKGIGKCTLSYHLINFILSENEVFSYDLKSLCINKDNKSFKLIQNGSSPNFTLVDVDVEKKNINILQIRNLINNLNKSSFNSKPRFILIDNIEFLNINATNALLKILEEPNKNIFFILIHNNKKIPTTLLSRCIDFKISMSNDQATNVSNKLLDGNIHDIFNQDLLNYYSTPGKIYNLVKFSIKNEINLKETNLKEFLLLLINNMYYKKNSLYKNILFDFIEIYLIKNISLLYFDHFSYFLKRIENTKKFNLDEESLFIEFKSKLLNE